MMWFGVSAGKWELILVSGASVWCATFCSGLGLHLRAIHESADNNGTGIPSTLNTVAGHDGFNELFDHTGTENACRAHEKGT
jgi:hypothetical protein